MSTINLPPLIYSIPRSPVTAVGIPLAIAFASGLLTQSSQKWYLSLKKPPGEPTSTIFRYTWLSFYAGMGYSSHLVLKTLESSSTGSKTRELADIALKLHYSQYGLNLVWSGLFFGGRLVGTSFIVSTLLTGTSIASAYYAAQADRRTLYCLVPYTTWILYSQYLHVGVWYLNFGKKSRGTRGIKGSRKDRTGKA